jgi:hypothetical protein
MRRPTLLIFINAMILIVVFTLLTQSLVIVQRIAKADKVSGTVEVRRANKGEWKELAQSGLIKTGDVVRTGLNSSAEFKWADGTRWKLMPSSEIVVKKSTYNMVKKADQSQLALNSGKVFVRIIKTLQPASQFEVETPTAVAAVRGTIFSVEVKNGKTQVAVFKGSVKVTSDDGERLEEEVITPGTTTACEVAGDLQKEKSNSSAGEFRKHSTIVEPALEASLKTMQDGDLLVSGSTESGNLLTINNKKVRVLGNGAFRHQFPGKTTSKIIVVTTDKHGESATKILQIAS